MKRTGIVNLPLHGGKAPKWLFKRMVKLSEGIVDVIIHEYGRDEFLKRISDPFWFQSLSCVLGFDYHSSGCTTVTCGALKEAIKPEKHGIAISGGKGKISRKTPLEIEKTTDIFNISTSKIEKLKYSSRMSAKIDNTAIQDGHQLYHHVFIFTENGKWNVIQQGINEETNYARRYHWFSDNIDNFVCEPHDAILGRRSQLKVLDMVSANSGSAQKVCVDLVCDYPSHLQNDWARLTNHTTQKTLDYWSNPGEKREIIECLDMPRSINWVKMRQIYDFQPKNYEELISIRGVGPRTVRALALISDLIYGEKPSWSDPVKYTFTVGSKDGVPYPVDRKSMDEATEIIRNGIWQAKIGEKEKLDAFRRMQNFVSIN